MTTLVMGASGATGRLLVEQLLNRGESVKAIVRAESDLPERINNHDNLYTIHASVLELSDAEMARHVKGCKAVVSCLGHNLSFKGIYGYPRRLVTDATRLLCKAIKANKPDKIVKYVLMNSAGNSNHDIPESTSFRHKCVIWLLRLLLPPHVDNEKAADFLRTEIGQDGGEIEWVAVRPDNLVDEIEVTEYEEHPSPIRDAIFDAGNTSRINVAHFMAECIEDHGKWSKWKGQMPVIYNKG
ncbi:MAG: SDR family oxidoreductase [Candidatus Thiodiazotropha sp. (ex Epidulcina cf. delphinae)]|nr:SDR family oxidoreductase [Candidatus Thiodiazotropha sp. (ex Epidulcina cf. delphinae)]